MHDGCSAFVGTCCRRSILVIEQREWHSRTDHEQQAWQQWVWRSVLWVLDHWQPYLGWSVLAVSMALAALPTMALGENRLAELRRIQVGLDLVGPLAVITIWLWLGWRQPRPTARTPIIRVVVLGFAILLSGVFVLSNVLVGWLPGIGELWQAARANAWPALGQQIVEDWLLMGSRFTLWWQGVQAGGAAQDNLIFAAIAGAGFWLVGSVLALLARQTRTGLLAAAPVLWLLGTQLLYSSRGRGLMVAGMLLAVALHILLDQATLVKRWQAYGLDFNPGLFWDRIVAVFGIMAFVLIVAALLPNLYVDGIVWRYYEWIKPFDAQLEDFRGRLFPDLKGTSRLRRGGVLDGLPNEFLLGGNVNLGDRVVMYVRTDDSAAYGDYNMPPFEMVTPPGHYMRGVTLSNYDGRGWSNPSPMRRMEQLANERWDTRELQGRKQLVQSISLLFNSSILFGAPEQLEPGLNYAAELRADGDLAALWSRARTYTVVSMIPAVSEDQLANATWWSEAQPLPEEYAIHLALPETISERTRQLADELTAGLETPTAKAQAIETYLRQYEYDLAVPEPSNEVTDVADYFLFDLRKGYCDYYATAFAVLARLAGLPTRFATGYAVGSWDPVDMVWIITEAEAHSWPEVYFPDYGWIPFEPTAGRPQLTRIGLPETSSGGAVPVVPTPLAPVAVERTWNWQLLFWLAPLALVIWGGVITVDRWRSSREDPWQGLLRWGQRVGRPIAEGETVLEYGSHLASHIVGRQTREPDTGRVVAREVTALSREVNTVRYGPATVRQTAVARALEHWQRLRGYLGRIR
jgi:transglutaminase-like putative cysteine protease